MSETLRAELEARIAKALAVVGAVDAPPLVHPATRPEYGDYQANGVIGAARRLQRPPCELAEQVLAAAQLSDLATHTEIAEPGFINVTLADNIISNRLTRLASEVLTAAPAPKDASPVVVDYSAPNLAKEMHVGHLRSTIIGDAVVRVLEHTGHRVIRQNHVGDWGTQFGMLLTYIDDLRTTASAENLSHQLSDLENFYRQAKTRFDSDPEFAKRARLTVVKLQSGDALCRKLWAEFIEISLSHCEQLYERLDVTLTRADVMAESAYNDDLATTISDLETARLITESDGAQCIFLDEFRGKDGTQLPLIVQKSNGGYPYATTDLAAVRHRHRSLHANRILYFVDKRQELHFRQVFAVARTAGFAPEAMSLEHMPFGTMLGEDGRPFRTRDGTVVKLSELLDEAEERAFALVSSKNPDLPQSERREIARAVGIGAVKYADLSKHRTSDYVFSWDNLLAFDGNTAPYLQYACSRTHSLFRRAGIDPETFDAPVALNGSEGRALALALVRLPEILEQVVATGQPHLLCSHLYRIATEFAAFYEQCPVLSAPPALRNARLALVKCTGEALSTGLNLLGIRVLKRM